MYEDSETVVGMTEGLKVGVGLDQRSALSPFS